MKWGWSSSPSFKATPSEEGKGSPVQDATLSLVHVSPRLEDFNLILFDWGKSRLDTHPPAPEIKGLISSEEGESPPSLPSFRQAGEGHRCNSPWDRGVPPTLTCGWSACLYRPNRSCFV